MTQRSGGTSTAGGTRTDVLIPRLTQICGRDGVITDPLQLRTYECDGLTAHRCSPGLAVLPQSAGQVAAIVAECARAQTPFVARGSGTGLSGGALPRADGVLIVLSKMRKIIEIDPASRRAVVEPGVTNLAVSKAAKPFGLFYAPDPSSQIVCSVGGNVAENSGGAHCLKHGFTVHHVTGLQIVTPQGELTWLGDGTGAAPGYDLVGAFTGSEGTLGIVTKIIVKLTPIPEAVTTLLAAFETTGAGGAAVSAIIGSGILPAAIEMMDALAIEAAEAAVACRYPAGAGAVLIVELDGPAADVERETAAVRELCEQAGAYEIRAASDDAERTAIWTGRKSAFAAVGRISPAYIVQDGVVPRTALPEVLDKIAALSAAAGIRVANVFHAGDGNLHPLVLFDDASPQASAAAEELSGAILDLCIEHGGSITGEHGVGVDKSRYLPKMFGADDLATMQLLRCAFDPAGLCNPGKIFPTPRLCGEVPGVRRAPHPLVAAGELEQF
jgi:glycolate oxidase